MEHSKLQIGSLIILIYIAVIYLRECRKYKINLKKNFFVALLALGITSVVFDGVTAFTVNNLNLVNPVLNRILHMFFLISLDSMIFMIFLYMLFITGAFPQKRSMRAAIFVPFAINILIVIVHIGSLEYIEGTVTNYSMGVSAYTCFIMVGVYIVMTVATFFKRLNYIESDKRVSIFTYLIILVGVTGVQMTVPETLISCLAVTISIIGIYMNLENPALSKLSRYHSEMVMGFATLIESRDDSTGGHVKRTSTYVGLIAEELQKKSYYKNILTKDYITNLLKAAPMHDIGKISVPDAILQKPGKLTEEEFEIMKLHSANGGKIIQETFGKLGNEEYLKMAYEVARHHHEKWNGKGYPDGLKGKEIPLCARIMAVADVFDAVSEKRCYRDAMPMDKCFDIIRSGSGQDFDPLIADIFLDIRDKVEMVHNDFENE
ncbi:MAG: HD domain-containing phosphohydrolase [Hominilimicola sp.]